MNLGMFVLPTIKVVNGALAFNGNGLECKIKGVSVFVHLQFSFGRHTMGQNHLPCR